MLTRYLYARGPMPPTHSPDGRPSRQPTIGNLITLVGLILLGGVFSALILLGILMGINGLNLTEAQAYLTRLTTNTEAVTNGWYNMMWFQALNHLGTFLLPALVYWYWIERRTWSQFSHRPLALVNGLGLVVLIVLAFMPFDGLIIEWNRGLHLPDTLAPLEQWIRDKEKKAEGVTNHLTSFTTPGQLLIAILVIGVIPAIGEEVLFRGILQRNFSYWTGSAHAGVWLAAALFSAIHVQFLGFFPRMLLGALFGYLFLWSENLWVPILAHFVNNGFTVLMVYLYQRKLIALDVESTEAVPVSGALVAFVITGSLLYFFRKSNPDYPPGPARSGQATPTTLF